RMEPAIEAFRKAISLKPGFALAEFNYGTTRLLAGDFAHGWAGYEQRVHLAESGQRRMAAPRWNGEPLPGQTLLIYSDQGFGDALQFVRDLPRAKEVSQARIVFECQRDLRSLFEHLPGVDELISTGDPLPEHAAQCALMSLPAIFCLRLEDIQPVSGYVQADPAKRAQWREVLERAAPESLRVGIVWQGNPAQPRNVIRSCRAEHFAPLADIPEVTLISLQRGDDALRQLRDLPPNIVELGSRFADFADAAAAVCELDLIVSVDTAMVHLAGALGCPVWTLLAASADWRWLRHRSDNPWYPTMRLFRQPAIGDWDGVFTGVLDELRDFRDRRVGQATPDGQSDGHGI
ncbi:MAG TPA: hypothetical protein VHB77_22815, partial [Planctomycetaceae bacterium]|nr:hypothetical protein [Planctomycetaceae bacterium]